MSQINEEYFLELASAVGNASTGLSDAVGTPQKPGTFQFYLEMIAQLSSKNLPQYGILATTSPGFVVSPSIYNPGFMTVTQGQVAYSGQRYSIPTQDVEVFRPFASSIPNTYLYGVVIGLPLSEITKSIQTFTAVVSHDVLSATATVLPIDNVALAQSLGFPLRAQAGNKLLVFSGVDPTGAGLTVDTSYGDGSVQSVHYAGEIVFFLYEPKVKTLCGNPVGAAFQSGGSAAQFSYYPPTPSDWLPIARMLAVPGASPISLVVSSPSSALLVTKVEWPAPESVSPIFSISDAQKFSVPVRSLQSVIRQALPAFMAGDVIQAMRSYTMALSDDPAMSFAQFWATRPFRASPNFAIGVSFDNLSRMEFSDQFASAYFSATGEDVRHTFAIFRGDMYGVTSPYINAYVPSNGSVVSVSSNSMPSALAQGYYLYGVTAATDSGETAPLSLATNPVGSGTFLNEIPWAAAAAQTGAAPTVRSYHVYRHASIGGDQSEYRLTGDGEITAPPLPSLSYIPANPVDIHLDSTLESFKITPSLDCYAGGIELMLKASPSSTSPSLSVELWSDASGQPGVLIATGSSLSYGALTSTYRSYVFALRYASSTDNRLVSMTPYWVVIRHTDSAPVSGSRGVSMQAQASGTALYSTAVPGPTWTSVNNVKPYFKAPGFVDDGSRKGVVLTRRGVRLTSKISLSPGRLCVCVPPLVTPQGGYIPSLGAGSSTSTQNELRVTVTARLGESGLPVTMVITVPQYTLRGTSFPLGTVTDIYDRVDSVSVSPGSALTVGFGGGLQWSLFDLVTVESTP